MFRIFIIAFIFVTSTIAHTAPQGVSRFQASPTEYQNPYYDIPVTYNQKIQKWVQEFQGKRRRGFQTWLSRSHRYLPKMKRIMQAKGLPTDLAYIALIESGLTAHATSHAQAVGYWQFIAATGKRYGLKHNWWLDERRDFYKSTEAAAEYLADLYKIFGSWYLTAAAYNMGETRLKRPGLKSTKLKIFGCFHRSPTFPTKPETTFQNSLPLYL
ncbi:MAG: lytic transglycosylase domain-containing protein [Bdellovibrionales bacterium]